jgi:hypothetical protein
VLLKCRADDLGEVCGMIGNEEEGFCYGVDLFGDSPPDLISSGLIFHTRRCLLS